MLAAVMLTGCRDDYLLAPGNGGSTEITEPSLVFDFNLTPYDDDGDNSGSIADHFLDHGENWENYVDPAKIRVIFCDMDGYFLFEVGRNNVNVISKDHSWSEASLAYRVIISQKELYAEGRAPGQNEAIRKAIEEDGFKVAVLANWPNFMEGPRERDPYTGDEMLGAESLPTELAFQWVPSDQADKPENSHISWLNHCIFDNVYGVSADDNGKTIYPYEQLVYYPSGNKNEGQMGVFTTWVQYIYNNQKDAALAIRQGQEKAREGVNFTYDCSGMKEWWKTHELYSGDPEKFTYTNYSYDRTVDEENEYSVDNIWRLWNFSAGHSCPYHSDCSASVKAYWEMRNENVLVRELNRSSNWNNGFVIKNKAGEVLIESNNAGSAYVPYEVSNPESGYISMPSVMTKADFDKIKANGPSKEQTLVQTFKDGAIHFKAYGEGTLRIRAKRKRDDVNNLHGHIAVLSLQEGYPKGAEVVEYITERAEGGIYSEKTSNPYFEPLEEGTPFTVREEYGEGGEYIIDPGNEPYTEVYIAAIDNDVYIYEIEYMRARHVYDSARNAQMPSTEHPIPMYGIQNFDPIPEELLLPDRTFNLSDERENSHLGADLSKKYNYKDIFLLRSVAKVEIRLKRSVFANNMPTHVFMRCMNRSARCEPKDVVNPTEWIWYGHGGYLDENLGIMTGRNSMITVDAAARPETFPGIVGEIDNIREYYKRKPLYESNNNSLNDYRKRSSWFYGIWGESGDPTYFWAKPWNWNNSADRPEPESGLQYPRIFNTRIDRSDFCRFHHVPDKDDYIRYIMYVPEKNISDADSKGKLSAAPKVQHIELRFADMNTNLNLDDNSHYRIYFTEYSEENGERSEAAGILGGFNRDGNVHTDNNTFDAGEKNSALLQKLQPIVRNCHYVFTVESINDKKLEVKFSVCGAAKRSTYGGGFDIK